MISLAFSIDDHAFLGVLRAVSKVPRSQKYAEFKGHIKPWKSMIGVELGSRYVMNTKLAVFDNPEYLFDPNSTRV